MVFPDYTHILFMLNTSYQGSRPSDFRQDYVLTYFLFLTQCRTCDPQNWAFLCHLKQLLTTYDGQNKTNDEHLMAHSS